jgi:hypothetical protein
VDIAPTDPQELVAHKKKEVNAKQVLLESMKDHLIHHLDEKKYSKDMYDVMVGLYQNQNTSKKLHLKHHLQVFKMSIEDIIMNYIMNIKQI